MRSLLFLLGSIWLDRGDEGVAPCILSDHSVTVTVRSARTVCPNWSQRV